MYGPILENLVLMELFKHIAWSKQDATVMHFRDAKSNEVDIMLETKNAESIGVKVKASSTITQRDFVGLNALAEFTGSRFKHGVVFYSGARILPFKLGRHQFRALPLSWLASA
jgi:uncharacterized protein